MHKNSTISEQLKTAGIAFFPCVPEKVLERLRNPSFSGDDDAFLENAVNPDFLRNLRYPYVSGYELGKEWLQTANIENIHDAAVRTTANEQIEINFGIFHQKFVVDGEDYSESDFSMEVNDPTYFVGDHDQSIADFFKNIREQYFFFRGTAIGDNPETQRNGYVYGDDAPNYLFRLFEQGWTDAVRDFYKNWLLAKLSKG